MNKLIFDSIASRYERVNTIISFGLWKWWNRLFVQKIVDFIEERYAEEMRLLDLCSGTGAVPKALFTHLRQKNRDLPFVDCVDISAPMIEIAQTNLRPFEPFVSCTQADVANLPHLDSSYSAVSISYGLRNVPLLPAIQEIKRVLKPSGMLFALELTQPESRFLSFLHSTYFSTWARSVGFFCTGNKEAYSYLLQSIQAFSLSQAIHTLQEEGFTNIIVERIMYGFVTLITAKKNNL